MNKAFIFLLVVAGSLNAMEEPSIKSEKSEEKECLFDRDDYVQWGVKLAVLDMKEEEAEDHEEKWSIKLTDCLIKSYLDSYNPQHLDVILDSQENDLEIDSPTKEVYKQLLKEGNAIFRVVGRQEELLRNISWEAQQKAFNLSKDTLSDFVDEKFVSGLKEFQKEYLDSRLKDKYIYLWYDKEKYVAVAHKWLAIQLKNIAAEDKKCNYSSEIYTFVEGEVIVDACKKLEPERKFCQIPPGAHLEVFDEFFQEAPHMRKLLKHPSIKGLFDKQYDHEEKMLKRSQGLTRKFLNEFKEKDPVKYNEAYLNGTVMCMAEEYVKENL